MSPCTQTRQRLVSSLKLNWKKSCSGVKWSRLSTKPSVWLFRENKWIFYIVACRFQFFPAFDAVAGSGSCFILFHEFFLKIRPKIRENVLLLWWTVCPESDKVRSDFRRFWLFWVLLDYKRIDNNFRLSMEVTSYKFEAGTCKIWLISCRQRSIKGPKTRFLEFKRKYVDTVGP